ncbi:hypothetical protein HQN89_28095 [Paenibacillus frigoriresistens]|uniref:sensor histidine kinase n=1 Tax=Paenibacillus alginolyticus TaxID=59839 RepID=UPI001564629F|nr:hypothetical protein [Paenibacillus frigoriresistens]NRF94761.1 hypothetical protein [Paenibacillus frigoriresistens]
MNIKDQGVFYLVNKSDSRIILGPDISSIGKPLFQEANLKIWNMPREETHFFVKDQGQQALVVYRNLDNTDWVLVGKVPVNVLLEQVNAVAKRTVLIGLMILLLAMLFASLLSSRVLIPIKRLKKGMRQIENGNYKVSRYPLKRMMRLVFLARDSTK